MAMIIGYINASWTLKVDIAAEYICRLLNYMDRVTVAEVKGDATELMDGYGHGQFKFRLYCMLLM